LTRQEILPPNTTIIDAKAPALKKRQGSQWKKTTNKSQACQTLLDPYDDGTSYVEIHLPTRLGSHECATSLVFVEDS
jgi:hypothetical protein